MSELRKHTLGGNPEACFSFVDHIRSLNHQPSPDVAPALKLTMVPQPDCDMTSEGSQRDVTIDEDNVSIAETAYDSQSPSPSGASEGASKGPLEAFRARTGAYQRRPCEEHSS